MQKLFLTGRPRTGKSSLLQKYLKDLSLSGFAMQRLTRDGLTWAFRLLDLAEEPYITHLESEDPWPDIAIYQAIPGKWQGVTVVFETKGRQSLERCHHHSDVVIMDELGIFETQASGFQRAVFQTFDSPRAVLGVLKDKHTPFLDRVRSHSAVRILPFPEPGTSAQIEAFTAELRRRKQ